jgi:hypothetical protein
MPAAHVGAVRAAPRGRTTSMRGRSDFVEPMSAARQITVGGQH